MMYAEKKTAQPILHIQQLSKRYAGNKAFALNDISIDVLPGQIVALLGESGSGKTTLLRLIAGFESADSGLIRIGNCMVTDARESVPPEHRGVGMVFQDYALFPHFNVYKNIAYGISALSKVEQKNRVAEVLSLVGLQDFAKRYPHELSGGQQQRVALARALAPSPSLLLLDEPFSNLDEGLKTQVRRDLKQILKQTKTTAVFVTHDTQDALSSADEIVLLKDGAIIQKGSPQSLYYQPNSRYVADYFGAINWIAVEIAQGKMHSSWGQWDAPSGLSGNYFFGMRPTDVRLATKPTTQPTFEGQIASQTFLGAYQEVIIENQLGHQIEAKIPSDITITTVDNQAWTFLSENTLLIKH